MPFLMKLFVMFSCLLVSALAYSQTEGLQHLANYPLKELFRDLSGFQDTLIHSNVLEIDTQLFHIEFGPVI